MNSFFDNMFTVLRRGHAWLASQDQRLLRMVEERGPSWTLLSFGFPGRSPIDVRRRYLQLTGAFEARDPILQPVTEADRMRVRHGWDRTSRGDWLRIPMDEIAPAPVKILARSVPAVKSSVRRSKRRPYSELEQDIIVLSALTDTVDDAEWRFRRSEDARRYLAERFAFLHPSTDQSGNVDSELEAARQRVWRDMLPLKADEYVELDCAH
jgi:hypothetical protein